MLDCHQDNELIIATAGTAGDKVKRTNAMWTKMSVARAIHITQGHMVR